MVCRELQSQGPLTIIQEGLLRGSLFYRKQVTGTGLEKPVRYSAWCPSHSKSLPCSHRRDPLTRTPIRVYCLSVQYFHTQRSQSLNEHLLCQKDLRTQRSLGDH